MKNILIVGRDVIILLGLILFASTAEAQKPLHVMGCSACKVVMLSETRTLTVYGITGGGPAWGTGGDRSFNDMKWDFVATLRVLDGRTVGVGYYKFTGPEGDYFILEANGSAITEGGVWKFLYGTGKWKNATGNLRGKAIFRGKPLSGETENYWCRIIGTFEMGE